MPHRILQLTVILGLLGTMGVGLWLRWWLAGVPLPLSDFGAIRHLHTHLGYYAVLFPLMWIAWKRLGVATPRTPTLVVYALATVVSAIGFGQRGYGPVAVVGSTVVLAVWLGSAWRARHMLGPRGRWLATVPLAIPLGAAFVPFVAMHAGTPRATDFVRSFLGMLLLGALLPTALALGRARHFPPLGWFAVVVVAGLSLGAVPLVSLQASLLVVGLLVTLAGGLAPSAAPVRAAWALGGLGLAAVGGGLLPLEEPAAVAGTHFLVLGPLLLSLWPWPMPAGVQAVLLALLALMCAAILGPASGTRPPLSTWATLTAVSGSALVLAWCGALIQGLRTRTVPDDP